MNLHMFFLILSLVLALLAGLNIPTPPRINLGWYAFAAFIASLLFTTT